MDDSLSRIVDALPGFVWTALPDGSIDFLNERWCQYTGLSADAGHGEAWQSAIHPDDLMALCDHWARVRASGQAGETEARFRRFDGEYRRFLIYSSPLRDASGQIVKWVGVNTDIEDRRRAEDLLAGEKRLLELVAMGCSLPVCLEALCHFVEDTIKGSYCSVVLLDLSGNRLKHGAAPSLPISFNEAIQGRPVNLESGPCAMAAHLREQVIVPDIAAETRWEASSWCPLALAHGLQACWSTPILSRAQRPLGSFAIYFREPRSPTADDRALIEQFTHIASIAIERSLGEAALRRSEAFLAEAQRLSSTGSFSVRVDTDELTWSDELYRIFELDQAVHLTRDLIYSARIHPEDAPFVREMSERSRRGEDVEFDFRLLMPSGSIKYLHAVSHGTWDQDGHREFIGTIHDVTQRRRTEEALGKVRSELARVARITSLGVLTASIAHEVNQPLSAIVTNAGTCLRMLAAEPPDIDGARDTARRTIRDGHRASDVITRLRALFTKKSVATVEMDFNEAIREVIALSSSELQRNRVVARLELANDLPAVTGDRVQLQQVILNLLLNASEAMSGVHDRPRLLLVRTKREGADNVRLTVRDVGAGFVPKDAEKLFDAFYTTKDAGMGIGLSVSRDIIESHNGRLWAEPNEGPGATFSFAIPSRSEKDRAFRAASVAAPASMQSKAI